MLGLHEIKKLEDIKDNVDVRQSLPSDPRGNMNHDHLFQSVKEVNQQRRISMAKPDQTFYTNYQNGVAGMNVYTRPQSTKLAVRTITKISMEVVSKEEDMVDDDHDTDDEEILMIEQRDSYSKDGHMSRMEMEDRHSHGSASINHPSENVRPSFSPAQSVSGQGTGKSSTPKEGHAKKSKTNTAGGHTKNSSEQQFKLEPIMEEKYEKKSEVLSGKESPKTQRSKQQMVSQISNRSISNGSQMPTPHYNKPPTGIKAKISQKHPEAGGKEGTLPNSTERHIDVSHHVVLTQSSVSPHNNTKILNSIEMAQISLNDRRIELDQDKDYN